MVATAPGKKRLLGRLCPVRNFTRRTISSLLLCRKLHFFFGKSTKTAATRAALFDSNMRQIVCRLALRPSSTGAPPYISAVFRGLTSKGRGRGSRGRRREGRGLDGRLEGRLAIKSKSCCNRLYFWNSFSKIVCSLIIKYVL